MNLSLDFESLTLDEVDTLETITGTGLDAIARSVSGKGDRPVAKVLKALAFISARRENPEVTLEEIGALPIASILGGDEEPTPVPPTPASES